MTTLVLAAWLLLVACAAAHSQWKHGTAAPGPDNPGADQVLPIEKTAGRLSGLIKDMQLVVVQGGPFAIPWTHADQINTAMLDFLHR